MIHKWLLGHPRYHLHFTPTSASWLNQVERWFAEITNKQIRRGSHRSTRELEQAIEDYLAVYNEEPKPSEGVYDIPPVVRHHQLPRPSTPGPSPGPPAVQTCDPSGEKARNCREAPSNTTIIPVERRTAPRIW